MDGKQHKPKSSDDLVEKIRRRAHEIWEMSGRPDGQHHAHWVQAEKEVRAHTSDAKAPSAADKAAAKPAGAKKPRAKAPAKKKTP